LIKQATTIMSETTKPEVPWSNSNAKRILVVCLEEDEILLDKEEVAPHDVYLQQIEFDDAALKNCKTHPKKPRNHRGKPR
jgi:hypothetical protein